MYEVILKKKICVFGGSKSGKNIENTKLAKTIGQIIAENDFEIIFCDDLTNNFSSLHICNIFTRFRATKNTYFFFQNHLS